MKLQEKYSRRIRTFSLVASFALTMLAGDRAHAAEPLAPVKPAEPSAFREVTAKLDAGGSLYAYLSTDQWLGALSSRIEEVRQFVLALPDVRGEDRANFERVFTLLDGLARHSGIESLAGVGISGVAVEKDLYRTRFVLQRAANSTDGYLWQFFGTAPHAMAGLDWLPEDTAWAVFGDFDLNGLWNAILAEARVAKIDPFVKGMEEVSNNVKQATGRSLEEQLGSLGGEVGVALVLDRTRDFSLPLPDGTAAKFPEPTLLIALKVKDDLLFDWVDAAVGQNPESTKGGAEGARWRSLEVPLPVPIPFRPTLARAGDYLLVASHPSLVERMLKVRAGQAPGLKSAEEFQRLSRGLPTEGNSFAFASQRFAEVLGEIQATAMRQTIPPGGVNPTAMVETFQRWLGMPAKPASYSVGWYDREGAQSVTQGNQEPSTVLVAATVVAPTAIMAGMMLPALAKAKGKAQEINCVSNLKQIALGIRIYAVDHDDTFPKDFVSMREELSTPRVLFCPADPAHPNASTVTWDNFDQATCSYEYLTPGVKESEVEPQTVVVRCKTHGSVALADGSVQKASTNGGGH